MKRKLDGDPFDLFCMYYLGLTAEGGYTFSNANRVAERLNCSVSELLRTLQADGLHPDTVLNTDFPLARYQADFQIAAESESKEVLLALAEQIYGKFRSRAGKPRDWLAEIQQEQHSDQNGESS